MVPGETTIYTLTVRNHGPDPATDILLTDDLPIGVIPAWAQSAQPLCGRQESNVSCSVGDLWGGDAITVTLDLSAGGTESLITGTQLAGVTFDLSAPTCAIDQDSTPPRVTCRLTSLPPHTDVHMRICVDVDAGVTGTLAHAVAVAADESDPDRSNNRAEFTMAVGSAAPVTVTAVPTAADLILHADGPTSVIAGQPFTYTFTITNRGTLDATGVRFENALPPATTLNSYTPGLPLCERQGDAFTCALQNLDSGEPIAFTLVITGHAGQPMIIEPDALGPGWPICTVLKERSFLHIVTCELGVLRGGQTARVQLNVTAGGVLERAMVNTASVSFNEAQPDALDNSTTATITVRTRADLTVRSELSEPTVAGKTLSYTLTVVNLGPSDADATLIDRLPVGARLISATSNRGNDCRLEQGGALTGGQTERARVTCLLGRLSGGEMVTVAIVAAIDKAPAWPEGLVHSARVMTEQPDPNPGNNALTEVIPVNGGEGE